MSYSNKSTSKTNSNRLVCIFGKRLFNDDFSKITITKLSYFKDVLDYRYELEPQSQ